MGTPDTYGVQRGTAPLRLPRMTEMHYKENKERIVSQMTSELATQRRPVIFGRRHALISPPPDSAVAPEMSGILETDTLYGGFQGNLRPGGGNTF